MQLCEPEQEADAAEQEAALMIRCQQGDKHAFGLMVQRYMRPAYFSALGLVGNHEDALDLSQEAFARAYRAIGSFDPQKRFFTWFYRVLRNLCLNHLRDGARASQFRSSPDPFHTEAFASVVPDGASDPARSAEAAERNAQLWLAIGKLPPDLRETFLLRELEGCAYAEIAARLEVPQGTVMSRLYNARKMLKGQMLPFLS